ncbi:MAG: DUF1302 family protein [Bdellovibrionales bacterium]
MQPSKIISLFLYFTLPVAARADVKANFTGAGSARFAEHIVTPVTPASERLDLNAIQKLSFTPEWSAVIGGKAFFEGVYQNAEYSNSLRNQDSQEFRFQDVYLQFKGDNWIVRLGNQQVVWGEAFGGFYSDIVNPKDFRDGTSLDLATLRRSVLMGNVKYLGEHFSWEGIVLPRPEFNVNPAPGSDFAPIPKSAFGFKSVVIDRELVLPKQDLDAGTRLTGTFGQTDLSLLYFNYYDRAPYYKITNAVPGGELRLKEVHARVQSLGTTLASDISGYVLRAEVIRTMGRTVPTLKGTSISTQTTDETVGVASLDVPTWNSINFSLQISEDDLASSGAYFLQSTQQTHAGARALINVLTASTCEILYIHSLTDGGARAEAEFMHPLASNLEARVGVDNFFGSEASEFGAVQRASRVYVSLRGYMDGFHVARHRR